MKATEITYTDLPCSYVGNYFNNNDNNKINYLSSSMPQLDQVIYALIVNMTLH